MVETNFLLKWRSIRGSEKVLKFYTSKPYYAPFKLTDSSTIYDMGWEHKTSLHEELKSLAGIFLAEI